MKKKIAILGSTGSIGRTLFKILKKDKINFEITLLTANKNVKEFALPALVPAPRKETPRVSLINSKLSLSI